ncbi:MAG: hypothetical protein GY953_28705, partial [bacterium]|nr:hypothetical protein [bacterium]
RGREFDAHDEASPQKVAVVNERFVQTYIQDRDPIGCKISMSSGNPKLDIEIVGVVADQKSSSLKEDRKKFVFLLYNQTGEFSALTFYLRTPGTDASVLSTPVRNLVRGMDGKLPVYNMRTVSVALEESIQLDRTIAALSAAFAALATLLASIGLYGLLAFTVARQTREFGTRIALGATAGHIFGMVTRQALTYLAGGLAIGLPAAFAAGR